MHQILTLCLQIYKDVLASVQTFMTQTLHLIDFVSVCLETQYTGK